MSVILKNRLAQLFLLNPWGGLTTMASFTSIPQWRVSRLWGSFGTALLSCHGFMVVVFFQPKDLHTGGSHPFQRVTAWAEVTTSTVVKWRSSLREKRQQLSS